MTVVLPFQNKAAQDGSVDRHVWLYKRGGQCQRPTCGGGKCLPNSS